MAETGNVGRRHAARIAPPAATAAANVPIAALAIAERLMAAVLVRALGHTDSDGRDLLTDDDDSIFESDIDRFGTAGVTKGCNPSEGNTKFCPNSYVTRGQMAAFLHRALG